MIRTLLLMICMVVITLTIFIPFAEAKKVVVLGVDGMDPNLLQQYMSDGMMPNFSMLVKQGAFTPLQTTASPQSPVAWSTFITGMDPGGHGIYDFIHRDPKTMAPFLSMSSASQVQRTVEVGSWVLPIGSGEVKLLRKGRAFWEYLADTGVPSNIFRMPVNFPPVEATQSKSISGMGTPDILGTPGTFSFYTDHLPTNAENFTGGKAYKVNVVNNHVDATLYGPKNPFRRVLKTSAQQTGSENKYKNPHCSVAFQVYMDEAAKAAKFVVDDNEFILKEKEWSDWMRIDFEAVPWLVNFSSTGRFYLKQTSPFELYVTPLQINSEDPVMPISSPTGWASELQADLGYFYTQELPEDTKAFLHGVFTGHEYWEQINSIHNENLKILRKLLSKHDDGLLFFYSGTVDQGSHMLWHYMDKQHPGHVDDAFLANGIKKLYEKMDQVLGSVLSAIDEDTVLIVMSDHGFAPFYYGVNLNTWLLEKGYIVLLDSSKQEDSVYFSNVDWQKTKAYALGLNGLYINVKGREKYGAVSPDEEYETLLEQLKKDLLALRDPRNGQRAITKLTFPKRDFNGPFKHEGPDLIVGYNREYRSSWESPLGKFPKEVFVDNQQAWSGDHCIDSNFVPGVLVTNQNISLESPALYDVTVSILDEFGITKPLEMIGRDCLSPKTETITVAHQNK